MFDTGTTLGFSINLGVGVGGEVHGCLSEGMHLNNNKNFKMKRGSFSGARCGDLTPYGKIKYLKLYYSHSNGPLVLKELFQCKYNENKVETKPIRDVSDYMFQKTFYKDLVPEKGNCLYASGYKQQNLDKKYTFEHAFAKDQKECLGSISNFIFNGGVGCCQKSTASSCLFKASFKGKDFFEGYCSDFLNTHLLTKEDRKEIERYDLEQHKKNIETISFGSEGDGYAPTLKLFHNQTASKLILKKSSTQLIPGKVKIKFSIKNNMDGDAESIPVVSFVADKVEKISLKGKIIGGVNSNVKGITSHWLDSCENPFRYIDAKKIDEDGKAVNPEDLKEMNSFINIFNGYKCGFELNGAKYLPVEVTLEWMADLTPKYTMVLKKEDGSLSLKLENVQEKSFVGDINMDGYPDFIFDGQTHVSGSTETILYLSDGVEDGFIKYKVATESTPGC